MIDKRANVVFVQGHTLAFDKEALRKSTKPYQLLWPEQYLNQLSTEN